MQSRKRVWLLFTVVIVAVFAMVGCIPEITPDKTPPVVTASSAQLSETTIKEGDPLTVIVQVTAEDKRSDLKNTQISLTMKKPGGEFTEVASATVDFAKQKKDTKSRDFSLSGDLFDVGGDYDFEARILVSDIKNNISTEAVITKPSTSLKVEGPEAEGPKITDPIFSPRVDNAVPPSFEITVGATDDDGDLVDFEFKLLDAEEDLVNIKISKEEGVSEISTTTHVTVEMGDLTEKTLKYFILARDAQGHTASVDNQDLIVRRTDLGFITKEKHLGDEEVVEDAQSIGNYEIDEDPSVIPTESPTVYELPFGITTLTFDVYPSQEIPTDLAKVFIYAEPEDIFNTADQFKRGESTEVENLGGGNYRTTIEFANLSADNAKWLALFIEGADKPWYVWKISAADHVTSPEVLLKDFGTIEEFIEGKPIEVKLNLKDELLLSLDDLEIQFLNNQETTTLEQLIFTLNQQLPDDAQSTLGWPTNDNWRFAVRYHAKVTFENYNETAEATRIRDLEPDPDPKTVYAISDPVSDGTTDHTWYRFDAETGQRVNWNNNFVTNDMLYFFGVPDRQIQSLNRPEYITDLATMTVKLYPEIVVVDRNDPEEVIFVSDAALGAGNRYILETASGYKQYNIMFTAQNAKRDTGSSVRKVFPIYADNTSPEIQLTYGPDEVKKYFADRRPEDLKTNDAYDRIAPPMFFVDSINLKAGQTLKVDAMDDVALYDFAVIFANDDVEQDEENWRTAMPPILNPTLETIDMPMGFDFIYRETDPEGNPNQFYTGQLDENKKNEEDWPLKTLNEILINEPAPIISKAIYTDIYPGVNPDIGVLPGKFQIDNRYELYENYTWSGVRNARTTASVDPARQELYFDRRKTSVSKEIDMPSVPGTYWVWLIARDRGAQDSWLFDYENDRVNLDPLTGNPEIYPQNVMYQQNNYFTVDPNLENVEVYYENSESESDAPMSVLLRVKVESHSMDIQRLDIHEPCLVSYPDKDEEGLVWFAHSYNVLQLDGETKVAEFDEGESREHLPRDMYPVFKRQIADYDAGNKFGLTAAGNVMADNLWRAVETEYYGDYDLKDQDTYEAVPVVGGNNPTTFRVKTHEDIEKVKLELIDKRVWTAKEYSSTVHTLMASVVIEKDDASDASEGLGQGGYWQWTLNLKELFGDIEDYGTIIVKAFNDKDAQFYEQWQWPIFVDTKGPEIEMYRMESVYPNEDPDEIISDHLKVDKRVAQSLLTCCPSTVERWVGFEVKDGGGLMFEYEKGFTQSVGPNEDFTPLTVRDLRSDRRYDLCSDSGEDEEDCGTYRGHKIELNANDSYYKLFQTENILNPDYMRRLGFPGDHPSVNTFDSPVASLKYLTREVREYEDLEITAPWHDYYTNLTWGSYDGFDWRRDPRAIPEIAFFNNIDLLNGLWENNDDVTMKKLEFTLRDELGNTGEWASYLSRKNIVPLDLAEAVAENDCRGGILTVSATANLVDGHEEDIKSIRVIEKEFGNIKDVLEAGVYEEIPLLSRARHIIEEFEKADVFAPAFQMDRELQIIVTTENETEMAKSLNLMARYAGNRPVLEIDMAKPEADGTVRSLREELIASGDSDMVLLLGEDEDYYLTGFDYPKDQYDTADYRFVFSLDFLADDDNVDKYELDYALEASDTVSTGYAIDFDWYLDAKDEFEDTLNLEMDFGLQSPPAFQHGIITAELAAWDCDGIHPADSEEIQTIMYQNPYTFVEEVYAVKISDGATNVLGTPDAPASSTSGVANGIYLRLQSDILFRDEAELIRKFNFEKNGITFENFEVFPKVEISGMNVRHFIDVTGAYLPNRAREFVIRVSPFSSALSMARSIVGTKNGFTYTLNDLRTVAAGEIDIILGANKPPTIPEDLVKVGRTFEWDESTDPENTPITYTIYLWEVGEEEPHVLVSNLTDNLYIHNEDFDETKRHKWYVVATDKDGKKANSEIAEFGGSMPISYTVSIDVNPSTGGTVSGSGIYYPGDMVTIQATPYSGWVFDGWTGYVNSSTTPYSFSMPAQTVDITANFSPESPGECVPLNILSEPVQYEMVDGTDYGYWQVRIYPTQISQLPNTGDYKLVIGSDEYTFEQTGGDIYATVPVDQHNEADIIANGVVCPVGGGEQPEVALSTIEGMEGDLSSIGHIWQLLDAITEWNIGIHVPKFKTELPDFADATSFTLVLDGTEYTSIALTADVHRIEGIPASYSETYIKTNGTIIGNQ